MSRRRPGPSLGGDLWWGLRVGYLGAPDPSEGEMSYAEVE